MHKMGRVGIVLAGMLVLAACSIYLPGSSSAETSSLLDNPGFEETVKVQYIEGWGHVGAGGGVNTTEGRGESNCLELGGGRTRVFANIPEINAGEEYLFSLYMKTVDLKENRAYVQIDATKRTYIGSLRLGDEHNRLFPSGGTTDWTKYEIAISPDCFPEGTTGLRVYLRYDGKEGKAYFDDISLVKKGSTDNLIENPGFEGDFSTEEIPEGYSINWWRTSGRRQLGKVVCDSSVSHSGKYSLRFEATGIATKTIEEFDEEGRIIRISLWIKTEGLNKCRIYLGTGFIDASGKYVQVRIPADGKNDFSATEDWTYFEKILRLSAGTSQGLTINLVRSGGGGGKVWFDDVCVEELKK